VSWLAGLCASPPSRPGLLLGQWRVGEALAAHSCGHSRGLEGVLPRTAFPLSVPLGTADARLGLRPVRPLRQAGGSPNAFPGLPPARAGLKTAALSRRRPPLRARLHVKSASGENEDHRWPRQNSSVTSRTAISAQSATWTTARRR